MFENMRILVTGGTGSWGNELTSQLLDRDAKEIRIFSRGELNQVNMQRKFQNPKLTFIIGDVRDYDSLDAAMQGIDYVFHLAALKHVPVCENQPWEAIKTNIMGTENVIQAAIKNNVKKVIDISTDKAVDPVNLYGMTKAVGERLIIQANQRSNKTKFICVRGGNVLGTNGSVVPYFKAQIERENAVTITNTEMTRFFLTVSGAIGLVFKAAEYGIGGEIFVMRMPACKIVDLAQVLIERSGKMDVKLRETGIRPGEKLHEILVSRIESRNAYKYDEDYYILIGSFPSKEVNEAYSMLPRIPFDNYKSDDDLMNRAEIEAMLTQGGFL